MGRDQKKERGGDGKIKRKGAKQIKKKKTLKIKKKERWMEWIVTDVEYDLNYQNGFT